MYFFTLSIGIMTITNDECHCQPLFSPLEAQGARELANRIAWRSARAKVVWDRMGQEGVERGLAAHYATTSPHPHTILLEPLLRYRFCCGVLPIFKNWSYIYLRPSVCSATCLVRLTTGPRTLAPAGLL